MVQDEDLVQRGPTGQRGVERATAVLRVLAGHPAGISLSDLARAADLPLTTAHRILGALRAAELVRETPAGLQALGVGTVVLAGAFLDGLDVRAEARPAMQRLTDSTGETCHLGVLASAQIVYLDKIDSPHPVRMVSRVGGTNPALTTAIGRSILAYSPPPLRAEVIEGAERLYGIRVAAAELEGTFDDVRHLGYATDLETNERGICCVGAPVFSHAGEPVAGISVSTPASRFRVDTVAQLGSMVRAEADRVSHALGWVHERTGAWQTASVNGESPGSGAAPVAPGSASASPARPRP